MYPPMSGSSLRSTRRSSLFSGLGRIKLLGMPFASRSLLVVLESSTSWLNFVPFMWLGFIVFVSRLRARHCSSNCSVCSSLVMTHPLFLLIRLITPQKAYDLLPPFYSSMVMFGVYWVAMVSCQICFVSLVLTSVDYLSVKLTYSCLRSSAVSHCVSKFRPMFGDLYWSTTCSQVQCMPFDRHVVNFSFCLPMVLFLLLIVFAGLLVCLLSRPIVSVVLHWRLLVIWFLIVLWLGVFLSCLAVLGVCSVFVSPSCVVWF